MLCRRCRTRPRALVPRESFSATCEPAQWERWRRVLCAGCGVILPPADANATVLETLSRLACVGLGAAERTLLSGGPRR